VEQWREGGGQLSKPIWKSTSPRLIYLPTLLLPQADDDDDESEEEDKVEDGDDESSLASSIAFSSDEDEEEEGDDEDDGTFYLFPLLLSLLLSFLFQWLGLCLCDCMGRRRNLHFASKNHALPPSFPYLCLSPTHPSSLFSHFPPSSLPHQAATTRRRK